MKGSLIVFFKFYSENQNISWIKKDTGRNAISESEAEH